MCDTLTIRIIALWNLRVNEGIFACNLCKYTFNKTTQKTVSSYTTPDKTLQIEVRSPCYYPMIWMQKYRSRMGYATRPTHNSCKKYTIYYISISWCHILQLNHGLEPISWAKCIWSTPYEFSLVACHKWQQMVQWLKE